MSLNICNCGKQFSTDHAMTCHQVALPTVRHNDIRYITASLLMDVCHIVVIEPTPLKME